MKKILQFLLKKKYNIFKFFHLGILKVYIIFYIKFLLRYTPEMKEILSRDSQLLPEPEGVTFPFEQISTLKGPDADIQTKINRAFGLQFSGKVQIV